MDSEHCDVRGLTYPTTQEAYLTHVKICDRLALKANLANSDEPYFEFYTVDPAIRCQIAVDISLPAKYLSRKPRLTIAWANHLSDFSISEGRRYLNIQSVEIALDDKLRRLVMCFIDLDDPKATFSYDK